MSFSLSGSDLAAPGLNYITVANPAPGGGSSAALRFTVYRDYVLTIQTGELAYDAARGKMYASRPSSSSTDANSISQIDPESGIIERSISIGTDPSQIVLSRDNSKLYVVIDQRRSIRRVDLATFAVDLAFTPDPARRIEDIQVLPDRPESVAVSLVETGILYPPGIVSVYDNDTKRTKSSGTSLGGGSNRIRFAESGGTLYGCSVGLSPNHLFKLAIDSQGVAITADTIAQGVCGNSFELSNGFMYHPENAVGDPNAARVIGSHPAFGSAVRPDSSTGRIYYVSEQNYHTSLAGGISSATVHVFDQQTFTHVGSFNINSKGTPSSLTRWSTDGLAFRTAAGEVHLLRIPSPLLMPVKTKQFSHLALGDNYSTSVVITNPSATDVAYGSVNFFAESGDTLDLVVESQRIIGVLPFTIRPLGSVAFTGTRDFRLTTGSVRISSTAPIGAAVEFGSAALGIAGVGENPPAVSMILPITRDAAKGVNTGVAMSNPQVAGVDVSVTLYTLDGVVPSGGSRTVQLPPNGHYAAFVNEIFPNVLVDSFQGTMVIRSLTTGKQISAVALQLGANPGEFTTLPVVPISQPSATTELLLPQFANGNGFSSSVFLVNASETATSGIVQFIDDAGIPLNLSLGGSEVSSVTASLAPVGGAVFTSSGTGALVAGWAAVNGSSTIGGMVRFTAPGLGIAGVGAARPVGAFITPVSRSVNSKFSTGIAVISTQDGGTLIMTLRDQGGVVLPNGQIAVQMAARGHIARFIEELFPAADTREFQGTLTVSSDHGPIAGMAIQLGSRAGEFTTLPVTEVR